MYEYVPGADAPANVAWPHYPVPGGSAYGLEYPPPPPPAPKPVPAWTWVTNALRPPLRTSVAYVLLLLVGVLGGHQLYLRRPVVAGVYFLTLGVFLVGWVVDLCTLPSQVRAANRRVWLRRSRKMSTIG